MKFRMLGPLEVIGDAGPVHLGSPSLRVLLLALLSRPNDVVHVDKLQEWLWPARAPRSATATLQAYVSALRRALEPAREPWSKSNVLITRPPGYLIRVNHDDLDSLAFESLLRRATEGSSTHDPAAVRGLLREALALWCGDALSDVAYLEAAQPVIRRLEELRLIALHLRVEAELRLGLHRDIVPDLISLVATYPVHEPFYGQLMLALYRCGRRAESLSVYARAKEVLGKEMGVGPGPVLRRLRSAIASDDAAESLRLLNHLAVIEPPSSQ